MGGGGKSTERLVEELAARPEGLPPLFGLTPLDVFKAGDAVLATAAYPGYTVPGLPPMLNVFNGFFTDTRHHIEIEYNPQLSQDALDHDWHAIETTEPRDGSASVYQCFLTGSRLSVQILAPEIDSVVRQTFTPAAIAARFASRAPGEQPATPGQAWGLLVRIVTDMLLTPPADRRAISPASKMPASKLDLDVVLPFLGFVYDEECNQYRPPREEQSNVSQIRRLRRILVEAKLEVIAFSERKPLMPALCAFFKVPSREQLSPAAYGCLGAVTSFNDERILMRYTCQTQNDALGEPWYLEALKQVAQRTQSEALEMRVIEQISLGTQTLSSIEEAWSKIGLEIDAPVSDEQLIDLVVDVPDPASILSAISAVRQSPIIQRAAAAPQLDRDNSIRALSLDPTVPLDAATVFKRAQQLLNSNSPVNKLEARRALLVLGGELRSPRLLALYELHTPVPDVAPTVGEAYAQLGVNSDVSDDDIQAIFEADIEDAGVTRLLELRRALRVIADTRRSSTLMHFLNGTEPTEDTDELEETALTTLGNPRVPVGLWNIGNTCYLNSLLQLYYSLQPVRDFVEKYAPDTAAAAVDEHGTTSPSEVQAASARTSTEPAADDDDFDSSFHDLHDAANEEEKEDGEGRALPAPEILADGQTVPVKHADVISTDATSIDSDGSADGSAAAATGAATVDSGNVSPKSGESNDTERSLQAKKIGGRVVPEKEVKRSEIFVEQLGRLFREIRDTTRANVAPSEILAYMALVPPQDDAEEVVAASKSDATDSELRHRLVAALQRQQDVTECIENVLYQMEATMKATGYDAEDGEQHDLIKDLFYGATLQTLVRIKDGGNRRTKKERFSSLLLDVSDGPTDFYDSMNKFFADEELELEEGTTLRTLRIVSLPPILQVQIQRVQFDLQTYLPFKNLNPLIFEDVVYLDRYLDAPATSELGKRQLLDKELRKELSAIQEGLAENGQVINDRDALKRAISWAKTSSDGVTAETLEAMETLHDELSHRLEKLETRKADVEAQLRHNFDDFRQHGYRVHALFIHKGDASYGHYWIYIRDPDSGEFYKYNDEFVSRVSREEVFDFRTTNLATPYFLVFVREGESLVGALRDKLTELQPDKAAASNPAETAITHEAGVDDAREEPAQLANEAEMSMSPAASEPIGSDMSIDLGRRSQSVEPVEATSAHAAETQYTASSRPHDDELPSYSE